MAVAYGRYKSVLKCVVVTIQKLKRHLDPEVV
jgi:hypothetical protein